MGQQWQDKKAFQGDGKGKKKQETPEEDPSTSVDSEDLDDSFDDEETEQGLRRWN